MKLRLLPSLLCPLLCPLLCTLLWPANSYAWGSKPPKDALRQGPSAGESYEAMMVAISEIFRQEVYRKLNVGNNGTTADWLPSTDLTTLQAAFFGTVVRFISENPALGGSFERGFKPVIWNAIVKVMFERTIPMTPDGVLLLPNTSNLRLTALAPELKANGSSHKARLFLIDSENQLVGPDMLPIESNGFETLDGKVVSIGNFSDEFGSYANLQESILSSAVEFKYNPNAKHSNEQEGDDDYGLTDCFRFLAEGKREEARACFKKLKLDYLVRGVDLTKDLVSTGTRGSVVGAGIGSIFPGMGTGAGAAYGAFTNMVMVVYNSFLKKEKISPNALRRLQVFVSTYAFAPTVYGEILPKQGAWGVTKEGVIRRTTRIGDAQVALDVLGNPILRRQTVRITEGASFSDPRNPPPPKDP